MLEKLRSELRRSVKIIKGGEEITPRFRVFAHDGDYVVFNPLPEDITIRHARMDLVRRYMVWKQATGFIVSGESIEPDAVTALAVWRDAGSNKTRAQGLFQMITRNGPHKPTFTPEQQAGEEMAGDMLALLPKFEERLSQDELIELENLMGEDGAFVVEQL